MTQGTSGGQAARPCKDSGAFLHQTALLVAPRDGPRHMKHPWELVLLSQRPGNDSQRWPNSMSKVLLEGGDPSVPQFPPQLLELPESSPAPWVVQNCEEQPTVAKSVPNGHTHLNSGLSQFFSFPTWQLKHLFPLIYIIYSSNSLFK